MKQCSACRKEKSTSEFARKGKGLQDQCKECKAEYNRRHYRRNKKSYMDRAIAQRREVQAYLENLKRQPCKDCGVSYPPYVMDFDHVRGEKKFNLCSGPRRRGVKQVMEEVAKCEVVCASWPGWSAHTSGLDLHKMRRSFHRRWPEVSSL